MNIFKPEEWTLIRQSLDTVTIQAITKRDKELEKLKENGNK